MLYDDQAATFDRRAGIPPDAVEAVARAAAQVAGAHPGQPWLEVGAGTGLLSLPLLRLGIACTAFDRSAAMLETYRARLAEAGLAAELRVADGDDRWPAEDRSVEVVFSARALHHLEPAHAAAEVRRVLRPGGWLLVGRVRREPGSPRGELRRMMRSLLQAHGHRGRSHERSADALFAALGPGRERTLEAARWSGTIRPAEAIEQWRSKAGLAGVEVDAETKDRVLEELRARAEACFGDLDLPLPQEESFELRAFSASPR